MRNTTSAIATPIVQSKNQCSNTAVSVVSAIIFTNTKPCTTSHSASERNAVRVAGSRRSSVPVPVRRSRNAASSALTPTRIDSTRIDARS